MSSPLPSVSCAADVSDPLSRLVRRCVWVVRTSLLRGCLRVPDVTRHASADACRVGASCPSRR